MRVLLAIDDSHGAAAPIREAATRDWPPGTAIRVLTVIEPASTAAYVPEAPFVPWITPEQIRAEHDDAEGMLASVAQMLHREKLSVETVVRRGIPGREIVDEAKGWGADLILVGTEGRTGLRRALMGSVAQWVVGHANCSVEVARASPAEEAAHAH